MKSVNRIGIWLVFGILLFPAFSSALVAEPKVVIGDASSTESVGILPAPDVVPCKKTVYAGCIQIKCDDGFVYDSCAGEACIGYVDKDGCTVTKCPGRGESRTCPPKPKVKETVTCVFANANGQQECYSDKGGCKADPYCPKGAVCVNKGPLSCTVDVKGVKGEKVTWKSTCGGYAYTTIDGQDEKAQFQCGPVLCKEYEDKNGCIVKSCPGEEETTTCPACTGYVDGNGCTVTKCPGQSETVTCPIEPACTGYVDSNGCTVTKCPGESETVSCPSEPICSSYTDANGCVVKNCEGKNVTETVCPTVEVVNEQTKPTVLSDKSAENTWLTLALNRIFQRVK